MFLEPLESLHSFFPVFVSSALFFIGMAGVLLRKNLLVLLMSLELMLNAVNLNLLAFAKIYGFQSAPIYIFFIICIAAAEAGVGLALATHVYKRFKTVDLDHLDRLKD